MVITISLILVPQSVKAQYDPYFTHYYDMQTSFNPAAAGKEAKLNIYGAYAMTMAGFENAPQTMLFAGDMPFAALGVIHGVGAQLQSDKIGLFTHQRLAAQYAVRKQLGSSYLSVGVQPGMISETFRGSDVELAEEGDKAFTKSNLTGNSFDLGVGVLFQRANWYVGLSAQHLTFPTVDLGETNELKIDGIFYATGGATFQFRNPLVSLATSAIVRSDGVTYRGDVTARLQYKFDDNMMYAGATYSPTNSATILIGGVFSGIKVGYSFEIYTNGISVRNGAMSFLQAIRWT